MVELREEPEITSLPLATGRAVAYVRMSTERQEYSTRNQLDVIEAYATARNLTLDAVYEDAGKSGLTKRGRPALCRLLDAVQQPHNFAFILVYDMTRWGRFQDIDESAYYEYLCRIHGVNVAYCAEPFENDGSPYASIFKAIKRISAADYSRELSAKVFRGQCRIIRLGYKCGGPAGYGLRRVLLNEQGEFLQILSYGERKALQNYRVVLAPGPEFEVAVVNQIFQWYVDGDGDRRIARVLNEQGIPTERGGPWTPEIIRFMLKNEKYIGNLVFNKSSFKLHKEYVRNVPENWVICNNAFPAVVPEELFRAAIKERARRFFRYTREQLIDILQRIYAKHGQITHRLIENDCAAPNVGRIKYHFGTIRAALAAAGIPRKTNDSFFDTRNRLYALRGQMVSQMQSLIVQAGGNSVPGNAPYTLLINNKIAVSVRTIRCDHELKYDYYRWRIPKRMSLDVDFVFFAQMDMSNMAIIRYFLFARELFSKDIAFTHRSVHKYAQYGRERLAEFFLGDEFSN